MENSEISKKVEELLSNLTDNKKELDEIQSNCKHSEFTISDDPNETSFSLRKVCKVCKKVIGYPSDSELKEAGYTTKMKKEED